MLVLRAVLVGPPNLTGDPPDPPDLPRPMRSLSFTPGRATGDGGEEILDPPASRGRHDADVRLWTVDVM